ncbi:MAG: hypothetical protein JWN34_1891 [Bryobacterales bacterium]|nr:hypothetical protein [Bryobacterales bacterium]
MKALLEVFYQPGKLFESLPERRRTWVLPLILGIILIVAMTALSIKTIGMREIMRQRLATSGLSPEQMQQAMSRADSPVQAYVSYAAVAIGVPLALLVIAGVLTAFGMMTSRSPKFGDMFSMVVLSFVPYWLITCVMTILILFLTDDKSSLDINNLIATNAAAYVDRTSVSKGLYSILGSLDVLSFGLIGMLGYGFSKLSKNGLFFGLMAIGFLWICYIIMKMGASILM